MLLTISKQKKLFSYSSSFLFSYSYSTTNSIDINKICIQIPNINFINKTIIEQQEKSTILYHIQYMYINVSFSFYIQLSDIGLTHIYILLYIYVGFQYVLGQSSDRQASTKTSCILPGIAIAIIVFGYEILN